MKSNTFFFFVGGEGEIIWKLAVGENVYRKRFPGFLNFIKSFPYTCQFHSAVLKILMFPYL